MKVDTLRSLKQAMRPSRLSTIQKVASALGLTSDSLHDLAERSMPSANPPRLLRRPRSRRRCGSPSNRSRP
jgi:hypothetical protein